ncbi:MAG TPA: phosphotransferase [Lacunisphaera sp.]|jgi:CheY-like chemotaxis protein
MNQLNVLLIEDRAAQTTAITDVADIKRLKVHTAPSPTVALREIQDVQFDVILLDLNLQQEELKRGAKIEFNGIALGQKIREKQPDAAIFMYSSMIHKGREQEFERYQECLRVPMVRVISCSDLISVSPDTLFSMLDDAVKEMRLKREQVFPVSYASDLGTRALLEAYGDAEISELVREAAAGLDQVKVSALKHGYSGSAVVRLTGLTSARNTVRRILKITRTKEVVDDEFSRRPAMGTHLDRHAFGPQGRVINSGKLFGILVPEVTGFCSLAEFLCRPSLTGLDKKALKQVVDVLLVRPAQDSSMLDDLKLTPDDYRLKHGAAFALVDFLEEASSWTNFLDRKHRRAVAAARKFVGAVIDGYKPFRRNGTHVAQLHGDFHCHNVFLGGTAEPVLIDFGRAGVFPRLFDFAALDVDLLLARMDVENGSALSCKNINVWVKRALRAYPFKSLADISNDRALKPDYLRSQVHHGLQSLGKVQPAEYADVLIFNLLRYLRFPNVTIPKKVLACHLIDQLVRTFLQGQSNSDSRKRPRIVK